MTSASTIRDGAIQLMRLSGLGGLRPNTVILGFYDQSIPEDGLRTHHRYKRRWLKSNTSNEDLFESSVSINTSDRYSTLDFPSNIFSSFEAEYSHFYPFKDYVERMKWNNSMLIPMFKSFAIRSIWIRVFVSLEIFPAYKSKIWIHVNKKCSLTSGQYVYFSHPIEERRNSFRLIFYLQQHRLNSMWPVCTCYNWPPFSQWYNHGKAMRFYEFSSVLMQLMRIFIVHRRIWMNY